MRTCLDCRAPHERDLWREGTKVKSTHIAWTEFASRSCIAVLQGMWVPARRLSHAVLSATSMLVLMETRDTDPGARPAEYGARGESYGRYPSVEDGFACMLRTEAASSGTERNEGDGV